MPPLSGPAAGAWTDNARLAGHSYGGDDGPTSSPMAARYATPVPDAPYELAATCRCLTDDLAHPREECLLPLDDVDDPVVNEFRRRRRDAPTGQEIIQTLSPEFIAYSLHVGRWRAATWHHARAGIVWLLAAAIHRSDDREADAYVFFRQLFDRGRLAPTEDDVRRALGQRARNFAATLVRDLRPSASVRAMSQASPRRSCWAVASQSACSANRTTRPSSTWPSPGVSVRVTSWFHPNGRFRSSRRSSRRRVGWTILNGLESLPRTCLWRPTKSATGTLRDRTCVCP